MAHTLKLGLQDDPTNAATQDFIDLGDATTSTSGYGLLDYAIGEPYKDEAGFDVRNITLQIEIIGTSNDVLFTRLRTMQRLIARTKRYYSHFGGQFPGRASTTTYDRYACILTFRANTATKKVYWDIMDGTITINPPVLGAELVNNRLHVTVVLTAASAARGEKVYLRNLLPLGDFAPPFSLTQTANFPTLTGGWTTTGTWSQQADGVAGYLQCATPFLKASLSASTASATLTSPAVTVSTGDYIRPQMRYFIQTNSGGGNATAKMQIWNGAAWSDQQTFLTDNATGQGWKTATGTTYTVAAGITQARTVYTNPANSCSVFVAGFALWSHFSASEAAPATEYITGGLKTGLPSFNVYGVQGDVPAPCILRVINKSGTNQRIFVAGNTVLYNDQDNPYFDLDYHTSGTVGGASTGLFWDNLPVTFGVLSSANTSDYNFNHAHITGGSPNGRSLDAYPRTYRAFIMYAANDSAAITAVSVYIGYESRTYSVSLPQTYTGTADAATGDFRLFDLGDLVFPRFGVPQIDGVSYAQYSGAPKVRVTHSTSANRRVSVGGVVLVPVTDSSAYVNTGTNPNALPDGWLLDISSEGSAPRFFNTINGSGYPPTALTSTYLQAIGTGGNFRLAPDLTESQNNTDGTTTNTCNHFAILMLRDQSASNDRLYTFNAQDTYLPYIEYFPRYLYGFR